MDAFQDQLQSQTEVNKPKLHGNYYDGLQQFREVTSGLYGIIWEPP